MTLDELGNYHQLLLSLQLKELGLNVGRLKTGTPARLDGNSIDFSSMDMHGGDVNPVLFI